MMLAKTILLILSISFVTAIKKNHSLTQKHFSVNQLSNIDHWIFMLQKVCKDAYKSVATETENCQSLLNTASSDIQNGFYTDSDKTKVFTICEYADKHSDTMKYVDVQLVLFGCRKYTKAVYGISAVKSHHGVKFTGSHNSTIQNIDEEIAGFDTMLQNQTDIIFNYSSLINSLVDRISN